MSGATIRATTSTRLGLEWRGSWVMLRAGLVAVLAAAPLGLLWASGIARVIGVVYAIPYITLMLFTSAPYLVLILDALLIAAHRYPIFLPVILSHIRTIPPEHQRRLLGGMGVVAEIAIIANPLSNVALISLISAARLQPVWYREVWEPSMTVVSQQARYAEPVAEIARPIFEAMQDYDLQHC